MINLSREKRLMASESATFLMGEVLCRQGDSRMTNDWLAGFREIMFALFY